MTNRNLLLGAGGHAKVIADILALRGEKVLGFLDDNEALTGTKIAGLPVLGKIDDWLNFAPDRLLVAIGDNRMRRLIVQRIESVRSSAWISASHPQAIVATSVKIDMGTVIMAGAVINTDTTIGQHAIINTSATVDHDCTIGDFAHIAPGVNLAGSVAVGTGAFLGIGCSVIPGCKIGADAVIGAGATVICDIPSGVIAKGVPARWNH